MSESGNDQPGYPRLAERGRTFVYILPCRDEDILKVGFSRDPLQRLHALHRRYFQFFDLQRALLVEVDQLRDARRVERLLITRFAPYRAPPPLVVRQAAAGRTEWFRGVAQPIDQLARKIASEEGVTLHSPLKSWLRDRFNEHSDRLYDLSMRMLDSIDYEQFNLASDERAGRTAIALRHLLDVYAALDLDLSVLVSPRVLSWYGTRGFAAGT